MIILLYNILEVIATFIESYICYQFNNLFIKPGMGKKECVSLSIILTILIFLLNTMSLFSVSTLFVAIIFVTLTNCIVFKAPIFDTFSITAFYSFCLLFFDFFSITLIGLFFGSTNFASAVTVEQSIYRCAFLFCSKILLILAYIFVKRALINMRIFKNRNLLFITIVGYIGVVYFAKLTFKYIDLHIAVSWLLLFVIIILLFFSFIAYISYYKEVEEKNIISMRNDMLYKNYKEISESYQANSILYHDIKNHLLVLDHLLEGQNSEQAKIFVKKLLDSTLIKESINYTWTGNDVIDCIINTKISVCKQLKIDIIVDADPINADLDLFVISATIPNLLDNAIDACLKCYEGERWLSIAIRCINKMILIKIENSINGLPVLRGNTLLTTKTSTKNHGWGMKSVDVAIRQTNGILNYSFDSKKFTTIVTLFL